MVNLSASTAQHIIEGFIHENRVKDKGRSAPNKIFNASDERYIVRKIKANPKLSAPKLATKVQHELAKSCSAKTVRRLLRAHNFNGRVPRKKPLLSKRHQQSRLAFAKEHVCKKSEFWNTVVPYSDESKFIERIMDKSMYLTILKNNLLQSAEKLFQFYQGNDPKHKSGLVQSWLIWHCPHLMSPPAQSPDMNVIENLWALIQTFGNTKDDLKKALLEEWQLITPDITQKLIDSMPTRLQALVEAQRYHTKH
ncbi:hypothetical protein ILUMI_24262 [Ignelater luminosus]|uniref:Transposase Tc1-like domain-containing protein n=1 Tax=Ignelater luminosus TaxID=2038154 RepID=A0A8K0C7D5_IGNLU|nr:hypothetical protein ILUMI_24262 [Ignelater luminosus]